jgi:hypothetical protein
LPTGGLRHRVDRLRPGEDRGELLGDAAARDRGGLATGLAVGGVFGGEAVEVGLAFDVAFDEVDAVVVIDGDVRGYGSSMR